MISKAGVKMIARVWEKQNKTKPLSQFPASHSPFFQDLFSFVPLAVPLASPPL